MSPFTWYRVVANPFSCPLVDVEVRAETTPVHASCENANEKWYDMNKTGPDNHEIDGEEKGRPRGKNRTWVEAKSRNKGSSQRRSDTAVLGS